MRGRLTGALAQIFANLGQMARGLLAVNVVQHGIHGRRRGGSALRSSGCRVSRCRGWRRCSRQRRRHRRRTGVFRHHRHRPLIRFASIRVGEGSGHQRVDGHRDLTAGLQLFHQLRQRGDRVAQQRHHPGCPRQRLIDDPIEQILDGPSKLGDRAGTHHAAAALQRMKTAAHEGQRLQIHRILVPLREARLNRRDLFLGFLDEQLDELRVDRIRLRHCNQRMGGRMRLLGALQRNRLRRIELDRLGGFAARDADIRDARRRLVRQRLDAHLRVVEHVPRIIAPALQRFHVVLDADDGIGHPFQADGIGRGRTGFDQLAHLGADRVHQFHRPALAEHQETGGDAAQQLRHVVQTLRRRIARLLHGDRHGFLDARHIDDALAQHRLAHQFEFQVLIRRQFSERGIGSRGQDQAHQLIVETVLDRQQNAGHLDQRFLGRRLAVDDDLGQLRDLILNPLPQFAQTQDAERVADLLQQLELGDEFIAAAAAAPHEDVEHILDLGEILLDRGGDRAHQLHAGRRQALAFVLDRIVDRQQLGELERGAHGGNAAAGGRCAGDVVQQVVQEIDRRILAVAGLAEFIQSLDLPVRLSQQSLQRRAAFQSVGAHRFENCSGHPPQLEHGLGGGHLFELFSDLRQNFQILQGTFAADVSQQADLKSRPQPPRPLRHRNRLLARLAAIAAGPAGRISG